MDDKTWELLVKRFDSIEEDLKEIKKENKVQTKMIHSLKITVTGVASTVTLLLTWAKTKFFGA